MNETVQQVLLPILRLPGRVMLPHSTRLLRLRGDVVREMASALRGERLLALGIESLQIAGARSTATDFETALLRDDQEPVCICKVIAVRRLPAGAIRVLVRGVSRGIHFSTQHQHASRVIESAPVAFQPDQCFEPPTIDREHRRAELKSLLNCCTLAAAEFPQIRGLLEQAELGQLCDLIAECVAIGGEEGMQLLAAANVELRSDILLDVMRGRARRLAVVNHSLIWPSSN